MDDRFVWNRNVPEERPDDHNSAYQTPTGGGLGYEPKHDKALLGAFGGSTIPSRATEVDDRFVWNRNVPEERPDDHNSAYQTPTGGGLGYEPKHDKALLGAFGGSGRVSGRDDRSRSGRDFSGRASQSRFHSTRPQVTHDGEYNPLRREEEVAKRARVVKGHGGGPTRDTSWRGGGDATLSASKTKNLEKGCAEISERRAASSLGWRASSGAMPSKATHIKGVTQSTLTSLTTELDSKKLESTLRKESIEKTQSGFELLEKRRKKRVGNKGTGTSQEHQVWANSVAVIPGRNRESNAGAGTRDVGGDKKNKGVHDRARLDNLHEIDFSANGVRSALERKAATYQTLLESRTTDAEHTDAGDCLPMQVGHRNSSSYEVDFASKRNEHEETARVIIKAPAVSPENGVDEKKRQKLLAMKRRGSERTGQQV